MNNCSYHHCYTFKKSNWTFICYYYFLTVKRASFFTGARVYWNHEIMSPSHLSSLEKKQSNSSFLSHNLCNTENVCAFTNVVLRFRSILICSLCLSLGEIPLNPFCSFRRSKYDILMEYVSNLLQQSPGQFATLISLKEQLVSISLRVSVGLCVFALSVCDNKCAFSFRMWMTVLLSVYFNTCELPSWLSFASTLWRT